MKMYQQGDVLLKKVSELPTNLEQLKTGVLQLGEYTGHKHQFLETQKIELYYDPRNVSETLRITPDEGKYLVVKEATALTHEEHKPIVVEPGIYQVDIVREFDYDAMEMRRVVD